MSVAHSQDTSYASNLKFHIDMPHVREKYDKSVKIIIDNKTFALTKLGGDSHLATTN